MNSTMGFSLLVALNVVDVVLTNYILDRGGEELNPIVRFSMDELGALWFLPKVLIFFAVLVLCKFLDEATASAILKGANAVLIVVAIWNLFMIAQM